MARSFTDVLRDINNGKVAEELTDELADAVAAAKSTGKSATLTLTLKLKPGKGGSDVMTVEHDIRVKTPEFERPPTYLFVSRDNSLHVTNPAQRDLELRGVEKEDAPVREVVDTSTGEIRPVEAA